MRTWSIAAVTLLMGGLLYAAFVAPMDADQGFSQKIFYIHVPMAITALCGFVYGAYAAIRHLQTRDSLWDLRSYVAIHLSLVLGVGVLLTGGIWAKAAWGVWFLWDEPTLVSFLIVFLLYCTYQPLRFSIEDHEKQGRYASVFAVTAGAFVPLNFLAVRLAQEQVHPRVLNISGGEMPGDMRIAFYLVLAGMVALFVTLWKLEISHKLTRGRIRRLRRRLGDPDTLAVAGRSAAPQLER